MSKFIDIPYFIMEDFIDVIKPYEYDYPTTGHLTGPKTGITAKYGFGLDLWIKDKQDDNIPAATDKYGYYKIRGIPISGTPTDNIYQFHLETTNYRPSILTVDELALYAGYDVYFIKKEHQIREFINNTSEYEDYVNINKIFLYFGKLYPLSDGSGKFNIVCNNFNNNALKALPIGNRTTNLKQLFSLFFDKIYSKCYNLSKNTWSMVDPDEVPEKYLEYIYDIYDMNYLSDLDILDRRSYAAALPDLLKRKGTYSSLYIVFRSVIPFTSNYLNVYERWHDVSITENINDNFEDHLYTSYPDYGSATLSAGAGAEYYESFGTYPDIASKVISPHYRTEIDLNNESYGNDYIFNEDLSDRLVAAWEEIRPVCKYAHYSLLLSPISDFTGSFIALYDTGATVDTKCCKPITILDDKVLYRREGASISWDVIHNLDSKNVVVQFFSLDLEQIIPSNIEYLTMNSIKVTFEYATSGLAVITLPDYTHTQSSGASAWSITHSLADNFPLIQIEDLTDSHFFPLNITSDDANNMTVTFIEDTTGYGIVASGEYTHTQSSASTLWTVEHNLDAYAVQVQCYNSSNELMYPATVTITTNNIVTLTFFTAEAGHAVIKAISKSAFSMSSITGNISYAKVGTSGSNAWDAITNNDLESPVGTYTYTATLTSDDNYYYVESNINTAEDMDITEIGIFDTSDDIIFYTFNNLLFKKSTIDLKLWYRIERKSN